MANPLVKRVMARVQDPTRITTISELTSRISNAATNPSRYLPPPATLQDIAKAESRLGFQLPPLLVDLYTTVANGGFGPGYGLIGLEGGFLETDDLVFHDGNGLDLVALYHSFSGDRAQLPVLREHDFDREPVLQINPKEVHWYQKLVIICNHGCWQLSCIDCSQESFPVISYYGYNLELRRCYPGFNQWIEAWLDGREEFCTPPG